LKLYFIRYVCCKSIAITYIFPALCYPYDLFFCLDESKKFIEPNSSNTKVTPENWILSPQVGIQLICNSRTKNLHEQELKTIIRRF
jgi:hypothetical protein